ncbi:nitrogenase iron-molybdenum cofactor biosynthesis protein NifE [Halorhodospira halochloris]|uniref:nitrogenase iron-molybdenum cofactor biosynthesis protein NifE n=1 Tax=Halorhodospira halochloris TaxID=1052 RepID=UPI001EE91F59|nr:nitrogenase iron-molybdenum cofactor biosynthesis protein NifE [Halorhodospira halochloris]MCG5530532.1 nitrogenase iron-molybdenum cofactor biosynthesis protein NifE [Halorhodospira halochloris]
MPTEEAATDDSLAKRESTSPDSSAKPRSDPKSGCKKGACPKPQPGATAGGCAFDGAQIALLPVADAAHIVHGPISCAGSSWDNRGTRSTGPTLWRIGMTTDIDEQSLIMGHGEPRLYEAIGHAVHHYEPAAVFVYTTCVPALSGQDIDTVCRDAERDYGLPVVPVDCAGFYGAKNYGNRIAGATLIDHVIGTREPEPVAPSAQRPGIKVHDIGMIGEFNIAGELWHVTPLFDELGLRLLANISGDSRFHEIQTLHRSQANMVVCSKAMMNVAERLKQDYGTNYFEGSFYGVADTSAALRNFAHLLDDPDLAQRTEELIAREEARVSEALEPWRERLKGKRALLYTGGVKSWSIVSALQDLGMQVVATGTRKSTDADKERIRQLMGEQTRMLDSGGPQLLIDTFKEQQADVLIAGGRNMYTALKARIPFLDINQERPHAYAGYEGMIELARQLCLTIDSPIWPQVREPAPWDMPRQGVTTAKHEEA